MAKQAIRLVLSAEPAVYKGQFTGRMVIKAQHPDIQTIGGFPPSVDVRVLRAIGAELAAGNSAELLTAINAAVKTYEAANNAVKADKPATASSVAKLALPDPVKDPKAYAAAVRAILENQPKA